MKSGRGEEEEEEKEKEPRILKVDPIPRIWGVSNPRTPTYSFYIYILIFFKFYYFSILKWEGRKRSR